MTAIQKASFCVTFVKRTDHEIACLSKTLLDYCALYVPLCALFFLFGLENNPWLLQLIKVASFPVIVLMLLLVSRVFVGLVRFVLRL